MKLVLTVTAVFDFSEDINIEEINDDKNSYGQHIIYKGLKIQPVIDFLQYQGKIDDTHTWEVPEEHISEAIYDCQISEDYTILEIEKKDEH